MNSKIVIHMVCVTILTLAQSILTGYIRFYGVVPDFLLVFVISNALLCGIGEGALIGLIVGLIMDVLSAKIIGLNALIFMYFGMFVGIFNKKLYRESVLPAVLFVAAATFIYSFYVVVVMFLLKGLPVAWNVFLKTALLEMIYNSVATLIIHPFVIRSNNWIDTYTKVFRRY